MSGKKVTIIGAGISSLSAASFLGKAGYEVTILEKNETIGGRGRQFSAEGFVFDMGPSWYWMPEVFENFFNAFDKKVEDFYKLIRLDPSYRVVFGKNDFLDLPSDYTELKALFLK
jgi:phytoene desaturase